MGTTRRINGLAAALGAVSEADQERVARIAMTRLTGVAMHYVGSQDEAMDCAQEAMIKAVNAFDTFEGRSNVTTWLHRIAVNCALEHLRRRGSRNEVSIDDLLPDFDDAGFLNDRFVVSDDSAEIMLQRADARAAVTSAIAALPDSHRTVLLLRDIEEMSIGEVADRLDVTQNTAKVRIHRARSALRKHLAPLMAAGQI
ncbi:MAG: sigma-70 family RNA polymerase sigma factor [Minwuia sp.]|nr:sigma-70 family RNA polymerase sigma factor [Minwuia sp.]